MASGLPCGAVVASRAHMDLFSDHPKLGHITTFGGNPVVAAAALATLRVLIDSDLMAQVKTKELLFRSLLQHPLIQEIRGSGLMLALIMPHAEIADYLVLEAAENQLILFWLLIEKKAVRITPPLTISEQEITLGCQLILSILDRYNRSSVN
jgi:acetylornithine/succinyldiaminopimelate/putrescine aminotransferase